MWQSNKMVAVRRMASGLSHELNNLFTAINGNLQLIHYYYSPRDEVLEIIGDVLRTATQSMALAQKLQAVAGQLELHPELFDLREVIRSISALPLLNDVNVVLDLSQAPCPVFLDKEKTRAMLVELATNARAATGPGDTITFGMNIANPVDYARDGASRGVRLVITDTGHGMSPEVLMNAFDPMFTTKPNPRAGDGWGLALAVGLIHQLGGRLELLRPIGRGTRVEIYLPLP
jgi:signal transduction histidine kinase